MALQALDRIGKHRKLLEIDRDARIKDWTSNQMGIEQTKALRERLDQAMENPDIPKLKPIWQEDGSPTTYLPG